MSGAEVEIYDCSIIGNAGGGFLRYDDNDARGNIVAKSRISGTVIAANGGVGVYSEVPVDIDNSQIIGNSGGGVSLHDGRPRADLTEEQIQELRDAVRRIDERFGEISEQQLQEIAKLARTSFSPSGFVGQLRKLIPELADIVTIASGIFQAVIAVLPK